jgi:hypothetical protein
MVSGWVSASSCFRRRCRQSPVVEALARSNAVSTSLQCCNARPALGEGSVHVPRPVRVELRQHGSAASASCTTAVAAQLMAGWRTEPYMTILSLKGVFYTSTWSRWKSHRARVMHGWLEQGRERFRAESRRYVLSTAVRSVAPTSRQRRAGTDHGCCCFGQRHRPALDVLNTIFRRCPGVRDRRKAGFSCRSVHAAVAASCRHEIEVFRPKKTEVVATSDGAAFGLMPSPQQQQLQLSEMEPHAAIARGAARSDDYHARRGDQSSSPHGQRCQAAGTCVAAAARRASQLAARR